MTVTATASCRTSGKEARSPEPPPLRTVRAPFDAYGSSIGQRTPEKHAVVRIGLEDDLYVTAREPTTEPSEAAPARSITLPPTYLHCFLKSVCSRFTYANTRGKSAGFRRGMISPCGSIPIRPITDRPSLAPSSFTRRPIGASCEAAFLMATDCHQKRRRAYHVPPLSPCGLGRASSPVVPQLRRRSSEPPDLTTCLFGPSVSASYACPWLRRFTALHLS